MANNKFLKKIMTILLIAVMTAAMFTSCTDDDEADGYENGGETVSVEEDAPTDENGGTVRILPNLPEMNWEGYTFRVLTSDYGAYNSGLEIWNPRDISAEETTGEPLNNAVFYRNMVLEERYNFTVEQVFTRGSARDVFRTSVAAGNAYFDVACLDLTSIMTAAMEGLVVNLLDMYYIDFDKPWWNQSMVELQLGGKLFFASGDFTLVNKDSISVILFNKGLIADLYLESPYELVNRGQWTLGALYEMGRAAAADLSGHGGVLDMAADRFGFIPTTQPGLPFMFGAGVRGAEKWSDGTPVLVFGNERNFNAIFAVNNLYRSAFTCTTANTRISLDGETMRDAFVNVFAEGRGLFLETNVRTIETLRGDAVDFGVLPMPWLDEYQREWRHITGSGFSTSLAVPNFHEIDSLDRVGFILEAISAESRYTVIPAHRNIQLEGKFVRDEESSEMLDIIFNSVIWDLGMAYGWMNSAVWMSVVSGTIASDWERHQGVIELAMQRTIDAFAKMD
jgi:hypothetical protein